MKLSTIRAHVDRIENGGWVDDIPGFGDLRLKVRGITSSPARRLRAEALARIGDDVVSSDAILTEQQQAAVMGEIILGALLLDWENLTGDNDDDVIAYSPEMAERLVNAPDLVALRAAILWAAAEVGKGRSGESVRDLVNGETSP